ncbi:phosphatase PAP2 family protein [Acidipila sp. 4G-K13]|nr:phosphatase PAP2 family protein [Paracidobacterium acidisoli]
MAALEGLVPTATLLLDSNANGKSALGANFAITEGIHTGKITQPTLLPFTEQQQLALQDTFMTTGNLAGFADGLGTTLGGAYVARAHYSSRTDYTNLSAELSGLIAYAHTTTSLNANSAKFFFGNLTKDGTVGVSLQAKNILRAADGVTDIYGKAYHLEAGEPGADPYGNSRPFQTLPETMEIAGVDYFNISSTNTLYNRGIMMDLTKSPSYPSGHTVFGYTAAVMLAVLVPDRYQQMIVRGAEYGNNRILMGAHYAMDVVAGRTLALYDMAKLLSNNQDYVGQDFKKPGVPVIDDFRAEVITTREVVTRLLQDACGKPVAQCAREDTGRFNNSAADEAFYASTQTYELPVVYPQNANKLEDVNALAPEAASLLTVAFPNLSPEQANHILTQTEGPGGGFLDNGSAFGVYSRLNLYAAAGMAAELNVQK